MSDASPNGLGPATPTVARMSRWPLYAVLAALLLLGAVLVYSVNFAHDPKEEGAGKKTAIAEDEKPLWLVEGSGLALDQKKDRVRGVISPPAPDAGDKPLVQVIQGPPPQEDQEAQNIRRVRTQNYLSALSSPLTVKRISSRQEGAQSASGNVAGAPPAENANSPAGAENPYDPAADRDKEAFFSRAGKDDTWKHDKTRTPGADFEIKTGTVVPAVMLSGINSDLPGNLIAQVAQNVFDTATGQHLLIPQGARLYGIYDSRVIYGQSRVLVAWNRIIFPDGSSVTLGAMPGADMGGMAGFEDKVDNHYFRIFGSALMMSLVTGGMAYAMDGVNDTGTEIGNNGTSMQDEMTSALAAQLGQTTTTLLQKNLNIKPTLEIRPGFQFNIVVTKDIAFAKPFTAWR